MAWQVKWKQSNYACLWACTIYIGNNVRQIYISQHVSLWTVITQWLYRDLPSQQPPELPCSSQLHLSTSSSVRPRPPSGRGGNQGSVASTANCRWTLWWHQPEHYITTSKWFQVVFRQPEKYKWYKISNWYHVNILNIRWSYSEITATRNA